MTIADRCLTQGWRVMLDSASFVQFALGFDVCGVGEFWRIEPSYVNAPAIGKDSSDPFVVVLFNTKKAAETSRLRSFSVLRIDGAGNVSQVCESVITRIAGKMVYLISRPTAEHIEPSKTVLFVPFAGYADVPVAIPAQTSSDIASTDIVCRSDYASENTSIRVVVQQFAQALRGKIGLSHDAVLSLIGQRLADVTSAVRASLFSRMHTACAMGAE